MNEFNDPLVLSAVQTPLAPVHLTVIFFLFAFRHGWTRYIKFRSVLNLFVGTQLQRPLFTRCAPKNTRIDR